MQLATGPFRHVTRRRAGAAAMIALGVTLLAQGTLLAATSNAAAQERLAQSWAAGDDPTVADPTMSDEAPASQAVPSDPHDAPRQPSGDAADSATRTDAIEPAAMLWFERDSMPIVLDEPLLVVAGVTEQHLAAGPGQYPHADPPGGPGNHALAGHRTTSGAPFADLDVLVPGDTIHVVDRAGATWVYVVVAHAIVQPDDVWVVGDDPLGSGRPTVTLTTCHPRGSAAQRLVVWGELAT